MPPSSELIEILMGLCLGKIKIFSSYVKKRIFILNLFIDYFLFVDLKLKNQYECEIKPNIVSHPYCVLRHLGLRMANNYNSIINSRLLK